MVAHHLHLKGTPLPFLVSAWGVGGSLPLGLPASVTAMKEEWQDDVPRCEPKRRPPWRDSNGAASPFSAALAWGTQAGRK